METRIKSIKKNNSYYYAVQVKKWIFWKTLKLCSTWLDVENFFNEMEKIDEFNSKLKSLNKIVYDGWAVRNVYKNTGIGYSINFFKSYPNRRERYNNSEIIWADINGSTVPTIEIKTAELFGKECLEPMKLRITIEQIEEQDKESGGILLMLIICVICVLLSAFIGMMICNKQEL